MTVQHVAPFEAERSSRRSLLPGRRRRNRKHVIEQKSSPVLWIAGLVSLVGRGAWGVLRVIGTILAAAALLFALVVGGRWAVRHVTSSPRFALESVIATPSAHVTEAELLELAEIEEGARLLELDTDAIAARIAQHPWVESVRVERQLPSSLAIDIVERQARALVALEGLYLVDERGRAFKRATTEEAQDLPIVTGLARAQYVEQRGLVEAAIRHGLSVLAAYAAKPERPALSEINLHARHGVTLYLLEGGAEVRLGRGDFEQKLARLDLIFEAVRKSVPAGIGGVRVFHLDLGTPTRVPVRLASAASLPVSEGTVLGGKRAGAAATTP